MTPEFAVTVDAAEIDLLLQALDCLRETARSSIFVSSGGDVYDGLPDGPTGPDPLVDMRAALRYLHALKVDPYSHRRIPGLSLADMRSLVDRVDLMASRLLKAGGVVSE